MFRSNKVSNGELITPHKKRVENALTNSKVTDAAWDLKSPEIQLLNNKHFEFEINKDEVAHCTRIVFPPLAIDTTFDLYVFNCHHLNFQIINDDTSTGKMDTGIQSVNQDRTRRK
jgi:hypothetical protein